ncbi:sigma-70 family RNA polymerase sigma factor [Achromobacter aloeverae]
MFERYYKELSGFFSRSLKDREAAADVVQECYARALAMDTGGMAIENPRALLYRIGKNIVIDRSRRQAAEDRFLASLGVVTDVGTPSAEQHVMWRQRLGALLARLQRMPPKRRDVFILVRIYGYSHAEAAAHLGCTVVAVEKHIVRAVIDCGDLAPY